MTSVPTKPSGHQHAGQAGPPAEVLAVLGSPPLIEGEDPGQYYDLLTSLGLSVGARDAADWLLVDNACATAWSLRQLRNARATLLREHSRVPETRTEYDWGFNARVFEAYDIAFDNAKDKRKTILNQWFRIADGSYGGIGLPRQDFALKKLAAIVGVKQEPPRQRPTTAAERADAQMNAIRNLADVDLLIERLESRLNRTIWEIERRHLASAKLKEMTRFTVDATPADQNKVLLAKDDAVSLQDQTNDNPAPAGKKSAERKK